MGLREFTDKYGAAEQCEQVLFAWRWPRGFACVACGHTLIPCNACRRQKARTSQMEAGISHASGEQQAAMTQLAQNVEQAAVMTEQNVAVVG